MSVLDLVKKYLSQKTGVRHNTEANDSRRCPACVSDGCGR